MNQIEIRGLNKTTNLNFVGSIDDVLSFISKSNQIIFVDKTLKTSTEALSDFLDERIEDVFLVDHAEENKNLSKAEEAYKFLTEKNINRDHEIVAIGGGALTDFAGFIAATFNYSIFAQKKVASINLKDLKGKSYDTGNLGFKGPVVISFWATWCSPAACC